MGRARGFVSPCGCVARYFIEIGGARSRWPMTWARNQSRSPDGASPLANTRAPTGKPVCNSCSALSSSSSAARAAAASRAARNSSLVW
eukprot:6101735-Prymnesium_polylepis.1